MRAAGRTLTVGELREALHGLRDDDPVTVVTEGEDVEVAVHAVDGGRLDLRLVVPPRGLDAEGLGDLLDFVADIARGAYNGRKDLPELREEARSFARAFGVNPDLTVTSA